MSTWRQPWRISSLHRRPWLLFGFLFGVAAIAYLAYPHYRARLELAEARQLIENLELSEAKSRLESHVLTWPKDGEAHILLARINRMTGLFPTALSHLRQAEAAAGSPTEITLEKLLLDVEQTGEIGAATSVLQRYLDSDAPEAPMILHALSVGAFRVRRVDLADYWLHYWTEHYPRDWRGHFLLGMVLRNRGFWYEAEQEFDQVLALRPSYLEAHHWLGVCLVRSGHDYAKAMQHLEAYLRTAPGSPTALSALAQAQLGLNERAAAGATVARLLEQDSKNAWGLLLEAQIQLDDEKPEEALATLGKVDTRNSADPRERAMLLSLQAKAHRLLGHVAEAEACERRFRAMDDDIQQLGAALGKATKPGDKLALQRQIGLLYLRLGDYDEAQHWFNAVLRVKPDDKIVQQALDDYRRHGSESEPRDYPR